jgi:predicted O-methyltransferase YrrM
MAIKIDEEFQEGVPTISDDQLAGAKMYGSRLSFLNDLPKGLNILELGTGGGDYVQDLLDKCDPLSITTIDKYVNFDDSPHLKRFDRDSQFEFVVSRFKSDSRVNLIKGKTSEVLPNINTTYDYIYMDAMHSFDAISEDFKNILPLVKDKTIIGFNDYIMNDGHGHNYGVVQVVNHFLNKNSNWKVIGFALHDKMFCDIYIQKI